MKKICVLALSFILIFVLCLNASAAYTRLNSYGTIVAQGAYFKEKFGVFCVLDADKDSSLVYTATISYDDLSGICIDLNSTGLNCSLYENNASGVWCIAVNDPVIVNSVVGLVGNADGYVYVAEIDDSGSLTDYWLREIYGLVYEISVYADIIYTELCSQGVYIEDIYSLLDSWSSVFGGIQTTVNNFNSSVTTSLSTLNNSVDAIEGFLPGISSDVAQMVTLLEELGNFDISGILDNQDEIISLLQNSDAFTTDISGVLDSLDAMIFNQQVFLTDLDTMISNQQDLLALMQKDGAFTTDISGVLSDLDTMISNQRKLLAVLQAEGAFTTDISEVIELLYEMNSSLNWLLSLLEKDGAFTTDISGVLSDLDTMISNQQSILELMQAEGAFTTDISGLETKLSALYTVLCDLAYNDGGHTAGKITVMADYVRQILGYVNDSEIYLTKIYSSANYLEQLFKRDGAYFTLVSDILADLDVMLSNQQSILELMQADGALTTDISGLETKLSNLYTVLSNLAYYDGSSTASRIDILGDNVRVIRSYANNIDIYLVR